VDRHSPPSYEQALIEHPITPPPELIYEWAEDRELLRDPLPLPEYIANCAAQWGADIELEACCEEMKSIPSPLGIPFGEMASNALRAARRPKSPSLKDRLIVALQSEDIGTALRLVEQLDD
jgi:hypothetical protein